METRDYSKFKFLKTNREINRANVEKIKASIREWGIIPGRPTLVDGDYNIIDGQHRFLAIKELGHPVPYEVIGGDTIGKTMTLNLGCLLIMLEAMQNREMTTTERCLNSRKNIN